MKNICLVCIGIFFTFESGCQSTVTKKFDAKRWIKATQHERGNMLRDLLGVHEKVGIADLANIKLTNKSILIGKKKMKS